MREQAVKVRSACASPLSVSTLLITMHLYMGWGWSWSVADWDPEEVLKWRLRSPVSSHRSGGDAVHFGD